MNARSLAAAIVSGLCALSAHAETPARKPAVSAQQPAQRMERLSKTCPNMYRGDVISRADGGMLEYYQGWFYQAEVRDSASGWAYIKCYYGMQNATPSSNPVYMVSYELKGYKAAQCTKSGNNAVNCAH